jgi:chromosome partitioning protein
VAPVTIHHRVDYAASMTDGRTVMEADPEGRSAKEIAMLWDYLAERLRRSEGLKPTTGEDGAQSTPNLSGTGRRVPVFGRRVLQ